MFGKGESPMSLKTAHVARAALFALILHGPGWMALAQAQKKAEGASDAQATRKVEIRDTELRFLQSKHAGRTYEIDIWFPEDYDRETVRYPVIYVLDAEYNFGCVSYIAKRLIKNDDIPKVLVVGIAYNTAEDDFYLQREYDCTPPTKPHGARSGGAEKFVLFFETELIPYINTNFRTLPGDRTIVGHSIGGFFGTYVLFKHPRLFTRYIIVSPSLWYANEVIFEYEKEFAAERQPLNADVFLSTGGDESEQMVRTTAQMIRTISERRYAGLRFAAQMPRGEHHRSLFPWAYTKGLRWLFERPR